MASAVKIELKEEYAKVLAQTPDFILTRFSGLTVEQLTTVRKKLNEKNARYKVIKNRVFSLALKEANIVPDFPHNTLEGPIGVVFSGSDLPAAAKVLKDYAATNDKFEIISGVLESTYYEKKQVEGLANLPTKEQLLATIAAGLNSPATKIAYGMKEVMASLARAVKAVGEKNG